MSVSIDRRLFLKECAVGGAAAMVLLSARPARAAWPAAAFAETDLKKAMVAVLGTSDVTKSDKITIKAPDIAENGAVVPVEIQCAGLEGVESLTLFVEVNPRPLAEHMLMAANVVPYLSTRLKMAKTGDILAVIKAGGKLYCADKEVKVTIGGF